MPDKAGELYVTLKLKATEFDKAMRQSQKGVKKLEKNTKELSKSFGVAKTAAIAFATYGIGRLAKSFIDAASASQQYEVRLRVLLRSQKEGTRMFKEMSKYAGRVPFEFSKIMESATALSGVMKGGVDEVVAWMPMIGDLAAATGLGVDIATQQVIRMYSAGAGAADLFRDKGVLAMMGFKAKTAYTAEETRKMMMAAWKKMDSQFRGATDELAETWEGKMSMMADAWFAFRNAIMLDTGLIEYFEKLLGYATDFTRGITTDIKQVTQLGLGSAFEGEGAVGLQSFYAGGAQEQEYTPPKAATAPSADQALDMKEIMKVAKGLNDSLDETYSLLMDVGEAARVQLVDSATQAAQVQMDANEALRQGERDRWAEKMELAMAAYEAETELSEDFVFAEDARRKAAGEMASSQKKAQLEKDKATTKNFMVSTMAMMAQQSKTGFRLYQAYRVSEAIIDTIKASIAAYNWGMSFGGPAAPALAVGAAAVAAAFGAMRVAMIASESPGAAEGGVLTGPASGYPVTLHGTEAVIPLRGGAVPVTMTGESGGAYGSGAINVSIYAMDSLSVVELMERNPEAILGPLLDALGPSGDRTLRSAVRRR